MTLGIFLAFFQAKLQEINNPVPSSHHTSKKGPSFVGNHDKLRQKTLIKVGAQWDRIKKVNSFHGYQIGFF